MYHQYFSCLTLYIQLLIYSSNKFKIKDKQHVSNEH